MSQQGPNAYIELLYTECSKKLMRLIVKLWIILENNRCFVKFPQNVDIMWTFCQSQRHLRMNNFMFSISCAPLPEQPITTPNCQLRAEY